MFELNQEEFGYYGYLFGVCNSYWDDNILCYETLCYETTSGTIISLVRDDLSKGEEIYIVLVPQHREGGNHHYILLKLVNQQKFEERL